MFFIQILPMFNHFLKTLKIVEAPDYSYLIYLIQKKKPNTTMNVDSSIFTLTLSYQHIDRRHLTLPCRRMTCPFLLFR